MVVGTVAAVALVATGGPAAVAAATYGSGLGTGAAVSGTGAAVAGTSAVAGAGGAIAGTSAVAGTAAVATAGGAATTAGFGAATGCCTAAGIGGTGVGVSGLAKSGVSKESIGFCILGAKKSRRKRNRVTFDCWKPVLHDTSEELSKGMLMKDVFSHPHVAKVTINEGLVPELPHIVLKNIWNEFFDIDYVLLVETGKLACHARPIVSSSY